MCKLEFIKLIRFSIITFAFTICSVFADTEIKLLCNLNINYRDRYGQDNFKREVLVEVSEIGKDIFIITDDEYIGSVSNRKTTNTIRFVDNSNSNKWDISSTTNTSHGIIENQITIDRNTGKFTKFSTHKETSQISSTGTCSKVNLNKKLF